MLSAYHYGLHKVPCRCVDIKSVQLICSSCCVRRNSIEQRRNIRERSELIKRKSVEWKKTILGAPKNRDKLFLTKCDLNFLEYFQSGEMFLFIFSIAAVGVIELKQTPCDMERIIFLKSNSKEEYLTFAANLLSKMKEESELIWLDFCWWLITVGIQILEFHRQAQIIMMRQFDQTNNSIWFPRSREILHECDADDAASSECYWNR